MAEKKATITFTELMVSTLAMTDALAKLLIQKNVITDKEGLGFNFCHLPRQSVIATPKTERAGLSDSI